MAISFVQAKASADPAASATTVSVTITAGGTGNLICGMVSCQQSGVTLSSVKDNNGVSYNVVDNINDTTNATEAWSFYKENISGSPTSIVATFTTSQLARIQITEWSGIATTTPLDVHAAANPAATANPTVGPITTTVNGDLIYAAVTCSSTGGLTPTAGTGFTLRNAGTGNEIAYDESQVQSTAGSITPGFTGGGGNQTWLIFTMAFKAATAGGLPPGVQNNDLAAQGLTWSIKYSDGYGIKYRSWEKWNQQTPTVKTTFGGNYPWPNPIGYPRPDYFWSEGIQPAIPFNQDYWPNPQPVSWYQSWIESGNSLTAITQAPFSQDDWPNPSRINWYQTWTESTVLPTPTPGNIVVYDWHLVPGPQPELQTWSFIPTLLLTSVPQNPFAQYDWPLPRTYKPIDQFWAINLQLLPKPTPFFQNVDFPLPVVSKPIDQTWIQSLNNFFQSETFPFSQKDWPLPYPIQWYKDWYQALALYLPTIFPFIQSDWPNPRTYPPIDQFWSNNLNLLPQVNTTKPFNQNDWPLPRDYQRIDENFWQALALILPPPPPPPEITSSGRTWTREEWTQKLTQYVQQRQKLLTFSDMGKMGGRPRKS